MTRKKTLTQSAFLKRIKDTVKHYHMLDRGDRVLAAVSGGPDSVCLVSALIKMRRKLGIEVVVGNLDHGVRGKESKRDSDFVKRLSRVLGLKCVHKKINIKSGKKSKMSIEEELRDRRYSFLGKSAKDAGCGVIATGHTIDDQAETVLMRMISGSSFAGLAGIPAVRNEGDIRIIRPLIRVPKKAILQYLGKEGLDYVEDSTNRQVKYLRNKIRIEVIPFLEKYNPRLKRSLANLSDTLREDLVFIESEKKKAASLHAKAAKGAVSVKIKDMILQPKALRKQVFKELFRQAGGDIKKLTYRHWMDMDLFLRTAEKSKSIDLPGGIRASKQRDEITFRKK